MSTAQPRRVKAKVKLCAISSLPVFGSASSKEPHCRERLRTRQGYPSLDSCVGATCFPIGNKDQDAINVQEIAEPYLVPITTKSFCQEPYTSKSFKASETKKVALISRTGHKNYSTFSTVHGVRVTPVTSLRKPIINNEWEVFVKQNPIPPPKIISKREPPSRSKSESQNKEANQRRFTRNEGRELAYLVVDLTTRPLLRPRKSFDDFDVPANRHFKEQRTTLTRSFSMSASENQTIRVKTPTKDLRRQDSNTSSEDQKHSSYKLSTPSASSPGRPPLPPKRNLSTVLSLQPDSTPTGRALPKDDRKSKDRISMPTFRQCDNDSDSELMESSAISDLSSDAFFSSNEFLNNSEANYSPAKRPPSKPTPYSEHKKKRRTPPPPPKSISPFPQSPSFPPPPVSACTYSPSTASSSQSMQSLSPPSTHKSNSVKESTKVRLNSPCERQKVTHNRRQLSVKTEAVSRKVKAPPRLSAPNIKTHNSKSPYKYKPTQPPPRPPPLNPTLQQKVRDIKQAGQSKLTTSAPQKTKGMKPFISNPQLISSTKNIPGKQISAPHRKPPSSPPTAFGSLPTLLPNGDSISQLEDYSEDDASSCYEPVEFPDPVFLSEQTCLMAPDTRRPTLPSNSVQSDPMPRRFLSSPTNRHVQPHALINEQKTSSSSLYVIRDGKNKPSRQISFPEPSGEPEDYIIPQPTIDIHHSDGWQRNESSDEDKQEEEYVEMGSVLLETADDKEVDLSDSFNEASDLPENSYVDMHPVGDSYSRDEPEPIYMEMKPNSTNFIDTPTKSESLYYASSDLFLLRPDLTVKKNSRAKGSHF